MMKPRQRKLFQFLSDADSQKRTFTLEDASNATGLATSSLRTYLSKKLKDRWLVEGGGRFRAQGFRNMTEDEFASIMTQNLHSPVQGYSDWKTQLEELVFSGVSQGHPVSDTLLELADSITDSEHP